MKTQENTVLPVMAVNDRLADPGVLWMPLREHGAVLLRGAAFSLAAFEAATTPFAEYFRVHQDPARRGYNAADTTQSVSAGEHAIGLHAERASLPGRPELLFFCCVTPPVSGGETTICDGAAIVDRLAPEDVRALDAMTLTWHSTLDKPR